MTIQTEWSKVERQGETGGALPLLALKNIVKDFPGTRALDGVSIELFPGEIHALVGENGAGKSTMVNILSGSLLPDEGQIEVDGVPVEINGPADALKRGIATAYQEVHLVPRFTALQNILLGAEGRDPDGQLAAAVPELLKGLHAEFSADTPVEQLARGEKQLVQIARALCLGTKVTVLDEPTEVLSPQEVERLFAHLRHHRRQGRGVIYISHRLEEVLSLADRVTVLRDGRVVGSLQAKETTREEIIRLMVGGKALRERVATAKPPGNGKAALRLDSLTSDGSFYSVCIDIRPGEIVGIAGVPGSGRSQLLYGIVGGIPVHSGTIQVGDQVVQFRSPYDAVRMGLALVPSDRKRNALVLPQTIQTNVVLSNTPATRLGFRDQAKERRTAQYYVERLGIRPADIDRTVGVLSGGNQQKVLLARIAHQGARIILIDEPTQGVDVAGKLEIHALVRQLAESGVAVIFSSAEMDELMTLSHRIYVMRQGRVVGEHAVENADPQEILREALP